MWIRILIRTVFQQQIFSEKKQIIFSGFALYSESKHFSGSTFFPCTGSAFFSGSSFFSWTQCAFFPGPHFLLYRIRIFFRVPIFSLHRIRIFPGPHFFPDPEKNADPRHWRVCSNKLTCFLNFSQYSSPLRQNKCSSILSCLPANINFKGIVSLGIILTQRKALNCYSRNKKFHE